jgi:hypothetical protein
MKIILIILFLCIINTEIFYVSNEGQDIIPCGTINKKCKTINFTIKLTKQFDEIHLDNGEYEGKGF